MAKSLQLHGTRACPDCKVGLAVVSSGSILAQRCGRCRGIWLDPASFRRLCDEETRPPDEETAIARSAGPSRSARGGRAEDRVRYRACPECDDVMNRSNFGRVSGVVIDVCRPHGAWFDRGELAAIRRFLREGGVRRYERRRHLEAEKGSGSLAGEPMPVSGSADDIYDVLFGGNASWDVPSRVPRLLVALFFAGAGAWLLWDTFHPRGHLSRTFGAGGAMAGIVCLYFAWRALGEWVERR
jgi:Zn-finger nucleic acid-binding protein